VVNVADSTNVDVRLGSFKFLLCHLKFPPNWLIYYFLIF